MREIKFRAWHKEWKIFVNDFLIDQDGIQYVHLNQDLERTYCLDISQYTGLKDINGKEIYEGDIVNHRYLVEPVDLLNPEYEESIGEIYWSVQEAMFALNYGYHKNITWGLGGKGESFEIIGNIYENPELFEKVNDI
jgi:uncharacterized phage protein (TIGR01671 family)